MWVTTAPEVIIILLSYSQLNPPSPFWVGNSGSESIWSLCSPATPTGWYLETTISFFSTCSTSFFSHGVPLQRTTPILWRSYTVRRGEEGEDWNNKTRDVCCWYRTYRTSPWRQIYPGLSLSCLATQGYSVQDGFIKIMKLTCSTWSWLLGTFFTLVPQQ